MSTTNREIKFRAWSTRRKELEECHSLYWFEENQVHKNGDNDYIIEQYTGLKDRNGVEVYEGDILESPQKEKWEMIFRAGAFNAFKLPDKTRRAHSQFRWCTVIGNIHENPELLEE